ncbi:cytosolic sulfotransferase 16-like [Mangifera indica]|uniref:cytosolic sulfotransferase 16-like n=1 Tax=Mangifera indica TaxID=29780 RepID=UPI001CFA0B6D|nr:cytosolic sulfotransferase 16-like [Mangifera indica]
MAKALITAEKCFVPKTKEEEDETERVYNSYRDIISTLPRTKGWATQHLCQYQGFWFQPLVGLEGIMWMQQHFTSRPTDIYLVSSPKSDPEILPSPRIFATHMPFTSLPDSIKDSSCPIVYISRNPKDVLVSSWQFVNKVKPKDLPPLLLEEAFEMFSEAISPYGSFWDQVLGYWKASLELPEKIHFLKYEDIKKEPLLNIKRVAGFVGRPFCLQEEENGTVQEILKLCNFDNMKNLEVNKNGLYRVRKTKNDAFFREGKVGDWKNYLTNEMAERTS